jgi:hypothetical protein
MEPRPVRYASSMTVAPLDRGGDLAQVVRRDVGGHADRDAVGAVDQEVRDPRRQDRGLLRPAVVVRYEIDGVLVDVPQHLHGQRVELGLRVVADEPVGDEGVVIGVDTQAVHRLPPGFRDLGDLGVVEPAVNQRLDHIEHTRLGDAGGDFVTVALPPLDPVDVVLTQPVPLGPACGAVFADELTHVRDVIAAQRPAFDRDRVEISFQVGLLAAEEPDCLGEDPGVAPVGDDHLGLAVVVPAQRGHHAELQQQLLYLACEAGATGRVRNLDGLAGKQRRRAVALEQRLQEGPLDRRRGPPHELGHPLRGAALANHLAQDAASQRVKVVDIQLVQRSTRGDHPTGDVPTATDREVVGSEYAKEVLPIHIVEAGPVG